MFSELLNEKFSSKLCEFLIGGTLGTRGFFLANVERNREAEPRQPKADAGHSREHKLQPETAQEKPLAPRVDWRE